MKVYIINYNRLTWPKAMADWLSEVAEPVFVDNASTYPPLLEYYKSCPYEVVRLAVNLGNRSPWLTHVIDNDRFYAVTDPDLDLSGIPYDVMDILKEGSLRYPQTMKSGVSLRIDDLPDTPLAQEVREWESQWWARPLDARWYDADIDTTLAVYDRDKGDPTYTNKGVRSAPPYCARHLSWYGNSSEEELNYIATANPEGLFWTKKAKGIKI